MKRACTEFVRIMIYSDRPLVGAVIFEDKNFQEKFKMTRKKT